MNCPKCTSTEITSKHYNAGDLVNSSSFNEVENEFIYSIEYECYFKLKARINYLSCYCENCKYNWKLKDEGLTTASFN